MESQATIQFFVLGLSLIHISRVLLVNSPSPVAKELRQIRCWKCLPARAVPREDSAIRIQAVGRRAAADEARPATRRSREAKALAR